MVWGCGMLWLCWWVFPFTIVIICVFVGIHVELCRTVYLFCSSQSHVFTFFFSVFCNSRSYFRYSAKRWEVFHSTGNPPASTSYIHFSSRLLFCTSTVVEVIGERGGGVRSLCVTIKVWMRRVFENINYAAGVCALMLLNGEKMYKWANWGRAR